MGRPRWNRSRTSSPSPDPRIALALCEVEAGLRSPLQLEQRCHLTLWPKLSKRLQRSGGPAVPVGSLVRMVAQEHVPGLAEVLVLVRRGGRVVPVAMRLDGQGPLGAGRTPILTIQPGLVRTRAVVRTRPLALAGVAQGYLQAQCPGVVPGDWLAIVAAMTRIERLTERAITYAIAEADEELAVARLAFLVLQP